MILLDTGLIAEPLRYDYHKRAVAWLNAQAAETCYVTAISLGDILQRIARLPERERKTAHGINIADYIVEMFKDRILPFDTHAAQDYATVIRMVKRQRLSINIHNAQNAAIARVRNFVVASGNTCPFVAAGLNVIDPWMY